MRHGILYLARDVQLDRMWPSVATAASLSIRRTLRSIPALGAHRCWTFASHIVPTIALERPLIRLFVMSYVAGETPDVCAVRAMPPAEPRESEEWRWRLPPTRRGIVHRDTTGQTLLDGEPDEPSAPIRMLMGAARG